MVKIELNENELNNLKVFLSRVQLTGIEVPEFINIINKLNINVDETKKE